MAAVVIHISLQSLCHRGQILLSHLVWAAMIWGQTSCLHLLQHLALAGAWTCCRHSHLQSGTRWCWLSSAAKIKLYFKNSPTTFKIACQFALLEPKYNCLYVVLWSNSFTLFFSLCMIQTVQVCIRHCRQVSWQNFLPEGRCCQHVDMAGLWLLKGEGIKMSVENKVKILNFHKLY